MRFLRCICWLVTLGHWWKHYPGKKAYVKCRICGKYPKSMWQTLRRIKKAKKDTGLLWVDSICINVPYEEEIK